jgi:hypothetical protein
MDAYRISARPVHNCARAHANRAHAWPLRGLQLNGVCMCVLLLAQAWPLRGLQLTGVCMCVLLLAQRFVCRDCVANSYGLPKGTILMATKQEESRGYVLCPLLCHSHPRPVVLDLRLCM